MAENFPNLGKDLDIQVYETNNSAQNLKPTSSSPRYIIIKLSKIKDKGRILKAAREKKISHTRKPV